MARMTIRRTRGKTAQELLKRHLNDQQQVNGVVHALEVGLGHVQETFGHESREARAVEQALQRLKGYKRPLPDA